MFRVFVHNSSNRCNECDKYFVRRGVVRKRPVQFTHLKRFTHEIDIKFVNTKIDVHERCDQIIKEKREVDVENLMNKVKLAHC